MKPVDIKLDNNTATTIQLTVAWFFGTLMLLLILSASIAGCYISAQQRLPAIGADVERKLIRIAGHVSGDEFPRDSTTSVEGGES